MNVVAPCQSITFCPAGQNTLDYQPGDFLLIADKTFYGKLVTLGQRIRFGRNSFTKWNHAALIVNSDGVMIESDAAGVHLAKLDKYMGVDYYIVRIIASPEDRGEIVNFAGSCVNQTYGWGTIISIIFSLLTGLKFSFGFDGQEICSGLVARSLERTSAIFPTDASHITPCQLAQYYIN